MWAAGLLGVSPALSAKLNTEPKVSVAFILLHEFPLFAFAGFVDALRIAGDEADHSRQKKCRWTVIAPTLQPGRANCGVEVTPWATFPDPGEFDYLVVICGRNEAHKKTAAHTRRGRRPASASR